MPSTPGGPTSDPRPAKVALRDQILAARRRRPLTESAADATALAAHLLDHPGVRRAATVAAYVSVGREPGTGLLLDALLAAGKRVLLPVVTPGLDLDWAAYDASAALATARMGLLEPSGDRLGLEAIATADVVLVPGLAVSGTGDRLGRGGGCYDRALGRVPLGTPVICLLHDDEVGLPVPTAPHDRRVTAACSPAGLTVF